MCLESSHVLIRVYPRACGGTLKKGEGVKNATGLSPRVRGNLWSVPSSPQSSGSIPARAGEPGK